MTTLPARFRPRTCPARLAALAALAALTGCGCATRHLEAKNAAGPYSAAVAVDGTVWLAGKIGDPAAPFAAQVEAAIDAIESDLARLELTLGDVVSVNVFVTDLGRFGELNEIYARRFPRPWPARTTVGVASLPKGAQVELQAVARRS